MKPTNKKILLGAGVVAGGLYALAKLPQTKDTAFGAAGEVIAKPVDSLLATSTDAAAPTSPTETIAALIKGLPTYDVSEGDWGVSPAPTPLIGSSGAEPILTSKKSSSTISAATIPKIAAYGIMKPVQVISGGIGAPIGAGIAKAVGRTPEKQAEAVAAYPRLSHAVSMLTGGATARAPVTKKQEAAREKYPTTYRAFKGLFGWLGA
jgi:hypothetical protein